MFAVRYFTKADGCTKKRGPYFSYPTEDLSMALSDFAHTEQRMGPEEVTLVRVCVVSEMDMETGEWVAPRESEDE